MGLKNIDIIVMGKTGAGKSTIINATLDEDLAPTGSGQAVTKKNKVYSKKMMLPIGTVSDGKYSLIGCQLNMYDTVGLEIDNTITESTLSDIKKHIEESKKKMSSEDMHLVWFCVNDCSNRFENYELELIRKLSIDYEIPFIIVLTQCYTNEQGELEERIQEVIPEVKHKRVLAKDYKTRGGSISAFGLTELIQSSVSDYKNLKVDILERKLNSLDEGRIARIQQIENRGKQIIRGYESSATKIGFIPGGCIPIVHGMCIKMIADLNKAAGIKGGGDFASEIFADVVVGLIATPFMVVPLLSAAVANAYVSTVGKDYLKALMSVIYLSTDRELENNALIKERLSQELKKIKN